MYAFPTRQKLGRFPNITSEMFFTNSRIACQASHPVDLAIGVLSCILLPPVDETYIGLHLPDLFRGPLHRSSDFLQCKHSVPRDLGRWRQREASVQFLVKGAISIDSKIT